jgi:hypothetical protein
MDGNCEVDMTEDDGENCVEARAEENCVAAIGEPGEYCVVAIDGEMEGKRPLDITVEVVDSLT